VPATLAARARLLDTGGTRKTDNADAASIRAAAAVAARGARLLLVPAQNMMRRDKAAWWQERHNRIRVQRVRETGMWLASADVTGQRDESRIGLGPTCLIAPAGHVVDQVPLDTIGIAIAEINQP
jgi:predicted amidohydrolase